MNRRRFIGLLAKGAATAAVATVVPLSLASLLPKINWKPLPKYVRRPDGGWVSYRFHYTAAVLPPNANGIRYIRHIECLGPSESVRSSAQRQSGLAESAGSWPDGHQTVRQVGKRAA